VIGKDVGLQFWGEGDYTSKIASIKDLTTTKTGLILERGKGGKKKKGGRETEDNGDMTLRKDLVSNE